MAGDLMATLLVDHLSRDHQYVHKDQGRLNTLFAEIAAD
jgi:hypothetical protein